MTLTKDFLRSNDCGLLVLRLTVGGLMLFHGIHKLTAGVGFIGGMLAQMGLPPSSPMARWRPSWSLPS